MMSITFSPCSLLLLMSIEKDDQLFYAQHHQIFDDILIGVRLIHNHVGNQQNVFKSVITLGMESFMKCYRTSSTLLLLLWRDRCSCQLQRTQHLHFAAYPSFSLSVSIDFVELNNILLFYKGKKLETRPLFAIVCC